MNPDGAYDPLQDPPHTHRPKVGDTKGERPPETREPGRDGAVLEQITDMPKVSSARKSSRKCPVHGVPMILYKHINRNNNSKGKVYVYDRVRCNKCVSERNRIARLKRISLNTKIIILKSLVNREKE